MILDANGNPIPSDRVSLRELTFKELPRRLKVYFAAASAVVAATALLVVNMHSIIAAFSSPAPKLSLKDTIVSDDGYAARVDMFVINNGDATALITRGRVELLAEIRMTNLGLTGGVFDMEVPYDVTVTLGDSESVVTDIPNFARIVKPADADRISFNIHINDRHDIRDSKGA
jgi:hypothetical protein